MSPTRGRNTHRTDNAVFELIHEHGPICVGDLMTRMPCAYATVAASLKRLLSAGEIERLTPDHPQWPTGDTRFKNQKLFIVTRCCQQATAMASSSSTTTPATTHHASGARA